MFGFERKAKEQESQPLDVVFDMELLDRAMEGAMKNYREASREAAGKTLGFEEGEVMRIMDELKLTLFAADVKRLIFKLSEKE